MFPIICMYLPTVNSTIFLISSRRACIYYTVLVIYLAGHSFQTRVQYKTLLNYIEKRRIVKYNQHDLK